MGGIYQKKVREENLKRIIRFLHRRGITSRTTIAKELGLSPSAVTNLVAHLCEVGLIREGGFGEDGVNLL